jgi:hypothetical protein
MKILAVCYNLEEENNNFSCDREGRGYKTRGVKPKGETNEK